jgi:hypothetical protein
MVAVWPVTVSVPSALSLALVKCRKACPAAKEAHVDEAAPLPAGVAVGSFGAVVPTGEGAAVDEADETTVAAVGLTLVTVVALSFALADDAGAADALLDEAAAHPEAANASPAVRTAKPQLPSVRRVPVIAASPCNHDEGVQLPS